MAIRFTDKGRAADTPRRPQKAEAEKPDDMAAGADDAAPLATPITDKGQGVDAPKKPKKVEKPDGDAAVAARAAGEARFATPIEAPAPVNPNPAGELPFAELPATEPPAAGKKRRGKR